MNYPDRRDELRPNYEQRAIRDLCREFAHEVVAQAAEELDPESRSGYDIVRQMGELGLFGLPFPESVGGIAR